MHSHITQKQPGLATRLDRDPQKQEYFRLAEERSRILQRKEGACSRFCDWLERKYLSLFS